MDAVTPTQFDNWSARKSRKHSRVWTIKHQALHANSGKAHGETRKLERVEVVSSVCKVGSVINGVDMDTVVVAMALLKWLYG